MARRSATRQDGAVIRLENVTRQYPGTSRPALDGVTLEFEPGEFVFVTGPSGAGKSTLLKLLYAAERPDEGDVLIEDKSVVRLHPSSIPFLRRNLGVIFQDFKLLPRRSVYDNVALALEVCGQPRSVIRHKVMKMLKRVGLEGLEKRLPGALSAGEQQRAAIARALVNEPSIVLADEPTGNLDEKLSNEILDLLAELARERRSTVLVATHDALQVMLRGYRHVHIVEGKVESDVPAGATDPDDDEDSLTSLPDDLAELEALDQEWERAQAVVTGAHRAVTVRKRQTAPALEVPSAPEVDDDLVLSEDAIETGAQSLDELFEGTETGDPRPVGIPEVLKDVAGMQLGPFGELVDPEDVFTRTSEVPLLERVDSGRTKIPLTDPGVDSPTIPALDPTTEDTVNDVEDDDTEFAATNPALPAVPDMPDIPPEATGKMPPIHDDEGRPDDLSLHADDTEPVSTLDEELPAPSKVGHSTTSTPPIMDTTVGIEALEDED